MSIARLLLVLLPCALLLAVSSHVSRADPFTPAQTYDRALFADVAATALAFIAPRTLEKVSNAQLTLWGLGGLAMLEPRISIESRDRTLNLLLAGRPVLALDAPQDDDAGAWGEAASRVVQAGWNGSEKLRRGGMQRIIAGFFDELFGHLDPYSRYVPPHQAADERAGRRGQVELGFDFEIRAGVPVLTRLIQGGAAFIAGMRVGDALLSIDGESTDGEDAADIVGMLAGDEGSVVAFEVRGRDGRTRPLTATRELVVAQTVFVSRTGGLLVLRISSFNRDTGASIARELARGLVNARGIVLDLRGNRGGLLREAVATAGTMLASGPVARTVGRGVESYHDYTADGRDVSGGRPIVVLVDGRTASAAEALAAALADDGRAVLVGSATYGKGLVQTIGRLPDGGDVLVSWSRMLAPLGWPIQSLGVLPQICTSLGEPSLRAQLAALGQGRLSLAPALARARAARAPLPPAETLEIRDACPAAEGRAPDLATARFLLDHPKSYAAALIAP